MNTLNNACLRKYILFFTLLISLLSEICLSSDIIFFTQEKLSPIASKLYSKGITNHIALSQHWFRFPTDMTIGEYIKQSDEDAIARMSLLLDQKDLQLNGMHILLDLEGINSPRSFTKIVENNDIEHESYFRKLKLRFDTIRRYFPESYIGAYGYPLPSGNNTTFESLDSQMRGIRLAAKLGVLDNVDYVWCNAYQRFGPSDKNYNQILLYTEAAIRQALTIRKSDGTAPKIGVIFSQRVYNATTHTNHADEVHVQSVIEQRKLIKELFPTVLESVWDSDGMAAGTEWWDKLLKENL